MAKSKAKRDTEREHRIAMEIVVDAYDEHERAMGWYYYLEGQLQFPFTATCVTKRAISPLQLQDEVDVIGMPGEEECEREMFVTIRWGKDGLAVPLSQLKPISVTDEQTKQAVEDWHYWVRMGYEY
jgi:Calcium binding